LGNREFIRPKGIFLFHSLPVPDETVYPLARAAQTQRLSMELSAAVSAPRARFSRKKTVEQILKFVAVIHIVLQDGKDIPHWILVQVADSKSQPSDVSSLDR
jgi:hypothetical protein